MKAALSALSSLVHEQPDILGKVQQTCLEVTSGETATPTPEISRILALIKLTSSVGDAQSVLLKIARFGCFMHESNRQAFVSGGIIQLCLDAVSCSCLNFVSAPVVIIFLPSKSNIFAIMILEPGRKTFQD